ncbi:MAG: hypothetical protein M5T52_23630 [Ignavibacteriaceae bacterium]|nr:hypothetical protein [Ignavibacteriaceae bacterium]
MDNVWYSISRLVFELHPARVKEIANKIEKMNSLTDLKTIKPFTDSKIDENLVEDFIKCWKQMPEVSPLQISSAMQSAVATASILETNQQIEIVWTGPDTGLVSSRNTEQVLYELIALASDRIFLVSYVSYNVERLIDRLSKASEEGIKISILLEPSQGIWRKT